MCKTKMAFSSRILILLAIFLYEQYTYHIRLVPLQFTETGVLGIDGPSVAVVVAQGLPTDDALVQIHGRLTAGTIASVTNQTLNCAQ